MRQPGEPSVGEILESIKQVMARDHRGGIEPQRPAGEPGSESLPSADEAQSGELFALDDGEPVPVLELTDAHLEAQPAAVAGPAPGDPPVTPVPSRIEPAVAPTAPAVDAAHSSLRDLLSALAVLADRGFAPRGVPPGETSLEGLARELMRPMIAEWLDRNLPPIVERLAAAELARLIGKSG